jgi:hypothetical protein
LKTLVKLVNDEISFQNSNVRQATDHFLKVEDLIENMVTCHMHRFDPEEGGMLHEMKFTSELSELVKSVID